VGDPGRKNGARAARARATWGPPAALPAGAPFAHALARATGPLGTAPPAAAAAAAPPAPPPRRADCARPAACPPGRAGEKLLKSLLSRTAEWRSPDERAAAARRCDASGHAGLARVMRGLDTSAALRKRDMLYLARIWSYRSHLWRCAARSRHRTLRQDTGDRRAPQGRPFHPRQSQGFGRGAPRRARRAAARPHAQSKGGRLDALRALTRTRAAWPRPRAQAARVAPPR
jgi:hypothetical protein